MTTGLPQIIRDFEATPSAKISTKVVRGAELRTKSAQRSAAEAALIAARIRGQREETAADQSSRSSGSSAASTSQSMRRQANNLPSNIAVEKRRPPSSAGDTAYKTRSAKPSDPFSIIESFNINSGPLRPSVQRRDDGVHFARTKSSPQQDSNDDSMSSSSQTKLDKSKVVKNMDSSFLRLPQFLFLRTSGWLNPDDLACLVLSHRSFYECVDDLAIWVAQIALGRSMEEVRSHRRLAGVPAVQLLQFLSRQREVLRQVRGQQIAAGLRHSLVMLKGVVHAFGATACGQLGLGPGLQVVEVPSPLSMPESVVMVACGGDHSLLVTCSGSVWACGRNADGQLGTTESSETVFVPERIDTLTSPAIQAACGVDHSLILTEDGHVWGCGRGEEGQLGVLLLEAENQKLPQRIEGLTDVALVSCGADHSMALDSFGRVFGFGENCKGQLGLGHCSRQYKPSEISVLRGVLAVQVACGGAHTLVLNEAGQVYGFGGNEQRQLGFEELDDCLFPTCLHAVVPLVKSISCGLRHSVLLTRAGAVWSLGGKNAKEDALGPPQRVRGEIQGIRTESLVAGGEHTLCKVQDSFFSFGKGSDGQLGRGVVSEPCQGPCQIVLQ